MRRGVAVALALFLAESGVVPLAAGDAKPKKPKLEARALPVMGLAPVEVLLIMDLKGGDELEDFYCPAIEVDWDDGAHSSQESDCPPFEPGMKLTRHFTVSHEYKGPGEFDLHARLVHAERVVASAQVHVSIRAGLGTGPSGS